MQQQRQSKRRRERSRLQAQNECCPPSASGKLSGLAAKEYAKWFRALADPTRMRILNLLAVNREPVCVCDIVKHFAQGQPTISHHLRILREVRFIFGERRGTFQYYQVNRRCLAELPQAARVIVDV